MMSETGSEASEGRSKGQPADESARVTASDADSNAASPRVSEAASGSTDAEGYLRSRDDWSEAFAMQVAAADGITLTEAHWEVLGFLQEYYDNYDIAPAIRILTKQIGKRFGQEKGNSKYLYELFPRGPAKQACKYAGLPKPTGCV